MPRAEGPETALLGTSVELEAGTATSVRTQAAESAALCRECPPAYPHDDDFQELWKDVFFIEGSFVFATSEKFFIGRNMVVVRSGQSLTVVSVRTNFCAEADSRRIKRSHHNIPSKMVAATATGRVALSVCSKAWISHGISRLYGTIPAVPSPAAPGILGGKVLPQACCLQVRNTGAWCSWILAVRLYRHSRTN